MSQDITSPNLASVADVIKHVDGIPASRIRLRPAPGTATEQDLLDIYYREKRLCELVDGVLVEKPMGYYESRLAVVLCYFLEAFLEKHDLGVVAGESGMLRLGRALIRIPDVSFVSWERLPNRRIPREPIPSLAPDLAVEVLSQSNTQSEMARKAKEYFAAGVRLVWIVNPENRTLTVHTPGEAVVRGENDLIDGGTVLPGFSFRLRDLFHRAERSSH